MNPYPFTIKTDAPDKAIAIAKAEISKRGGYMGATAFRKDKYAGTYRQVPGGIEVTITDKPTVFGIGASNETIEATIREYFAGAMAA